MAPVLAQTELLVALVGIMAPVAVAVARAIPLAGSLAGMAALALLVS